MKRLLACLLVFTLARAAAQSPADSRVALFSEINAMEKGLSEITGLQFKRVVPYAVITKDELRRYLEQRVKETMKPDELRAEELTLKLLGLVPADFDLRRNTVDLLTEQAAAFYDYNKKKLFILEDGNGADEEIALVHELAHALADQHFRLGKYIREGLRSDDATTARQAVMEGQASWLMTAYLSKKSGGPGEVSDSVLDLMAHAAENTPEQYPVLSSAPPYIRESLVFPYSDGILFQNAIFRKLGRESFSEVFLHPPDSSQQILHPDRYLDHHAPRVPEAPAVPARREFRELAEGTLGELDYRILLSQYLGETPGGSIAQHLQGSSYQLWEHKRDNSPVLAYASSWDTPQSAQRYFEQYLDVLRRKWKTLEIQSQTASEVAGRGDSGYFRFWIDGDVVSHLEGWKTPLH
ncbi:MAG TPA: hypothetical protein VEV17_03965 [Bryobacteraceae bacterium]|nr:hypothetical protein [Bryobacteraceae bacterium]